MKRKLIKCVMKVETETVKKDFTYLFEIGMNEQVANGLKEHLGT